MAVTQAVTPRLVSVEGGTPHLHLHPGQARAWRSTARFVAIIAGSQGGKTSFAPWWLKREIDRCGPGDYLAATASYDLLKLRLLPALRECFEHTLKIGRYRAGDRVIEIRNSETNQFDAEPWARIIMRSAASEGGLESATANAAIFDEAGQDEVTVETWEALLRRLALRQGRVLIATTPYSINWLKTEVFDRWRAGDANYEVVNFPSIENPLFPRAEYERARASMPPWRFALFHQGIFERPAGLIYDCFDPAVHVVEDFILPPAWPRSVGIDFGGVNHAMVWIAQNPETGAGYVYRAEMAPNQTTRERATDAKAHLHNENVVAWYGGAKSEGQFRADWHAEGVWVQEPLIPEVESGINAVTEALKRKLLFVFRSASGLRDEFGSYRRKLDDSGQPTLEIVDKRDFHYLDATRYVAPVLVRPYGANIRFMSDLPLAAAPEPDEERKTWRI